MTWQEERRRKQIALALMQPKIKKFIEAIDGKFKEVCDMQTGELIPKSDLDKYFLINKNQNNEQKKERTTTAKTRNPKRRNTV